jgi:hypothetical protein
MEPAVRMLHLTYSGLATATRSQLESEIYGQDEIYALFDEDRLDAGRYGTDEYRAKLSQWVEND